MNKQLYRSNTTTSEYFQNSVSLFLKEIYDIMKECYGPYGSHILIDGQIRPEATKDGKTILSRIATDSSISTAVHGSIISVANKQVEEVGDGSTTTILLLCKLYEKFIKIIKELNISPSVLNKTIKQVVTDILIGLKNNVINVVDENNNINFDLLKDAVHTSVDGDVELTDKIIEMFKELNSIDPLVLIELSSNESHRYELVKGIESSGSIIRPDVFFNGLSRMDYEDPIIVVVNGRFDMSPDHYTTLAQDMLRNNKDVIILATGIKEELLSSIVSINRTSPGYFQRVPIFQIRNTALDEEFNDLCVSIGAKSIDSESFAKVISYDAVKNIINVSSGSCSKALLTEFCARFNDPKVDEKATAIRIKEIEDRINDLKNDPTSHNDRITDLENRKAFLSRHYAKFYVGGYSPQRKAINYELANDGIPQAISSMKHGIVYGCNTAVPKVIQQLDYEINDSNNLYNIIMKSIYDSYQELRIQLMANKVGYDEAVNEIKQMENNSTFNLRQDDNTDIINSADTDRAILENATDMAALLATTKGFISRATEFDVVNKGYQENK